MITNTLISLKKDSQVRIDAINTIKYTLLLDYDVPKYSNDKDLINDIFQNCQLCCNRLFRDTNISRWKGYEFNYKFFGFGSYGSYDEKNSCFLDINKIPGRDVQVFEPYLHNMILQHCVMSSYHAILTELNSNENVTTYTIVNRYSSNKCSLKNSSKSSKASDLTRTLNNHLSVMPFLSGLLCKTQFCKLCINICKVNTSKFRNIFAYEKSKQNQKKTLINNILKTSELLTKYEPSQFNNKADLLYYNYLIERIFNFRIFYSTLKAILFVNKNTYHRLDNEDLIDSLASITLLPNVFSRQSLLMCAILNINRNNNSFHDFWYEQDLSYDGSEMCRSSRKTKRFFDLYKWKEQLKLFTNYLSDFIIPIYEWCFIGMMLESIENESLDDKHECHLIKAKEILEQFMIDNYDSILHPVNPESCSFSDDMINITTNFNKSSHKNGYSLYEICHYINDIPDDTFYQLVNLFFSESKDFDLNLSTNLKPKYFTHDEKDLINPPTGRIRKFYIDLLRYKYWEKT